MAVSPEAELLLLLADQVECLVIASRDPHEREIRREIDRLRKQIQDANS